MRLLRNLLAFLLVSLPAVAQFTTVTGTVVDPNGIPYANGTIAPILINVNGGSSITLNGQAYTPPTQATGLNAAGSFVVNLAANASLLPAGTKWNFWVCSAVGTVNPSVGTGSQCFMLAAPITIAGATQSISANLNAAALALTVPIGGGSTPFGNITPGTNNLGAMHVGTGSSLDATGAGTIAATSVPWPGVTVGTNPNPLTMASGGSLSPVNIGQVAGSQAWLAAGLISPASTGANAGGSIIAAHPWLIQYSFQTALGETLPSVLLSGSTTTLTGGVCVSANCTLTITAPTFPSGVTGWNAYACDTSPAVCTVPQLRAACQNLAAGVDCTFTAVQSSNTSGVPTTNTAWVQPPNVQAFNGQPGEIPSVFFPKTDGNNYPWVSVDFTDDPIGSGAIGTPMFTHRTFASDIPGKNIQYASNLAYKNSFWTINHRYGIGTSTTNQDRALSIFSENSPANDTASYKGFFGIQQELDINGNPTFTPGPDNNIFGAQFQISTMMTGNSGAPLPATIAAVNASVFNAGTGYLFGSGNVLKGVNSSFTNNASTAAPAGYTWYGYDSSWGIGTGLATNMFGYGYSCTLPTTAVKFSTGNACWFIPNRALTPGNNDQALESDWNTSPGLSWLLAGPVVINGISSDQVQTMPINASANVIGSVTSSQISFTGSGMSGSCSGGASSYTYQLVFIDGNGGASPASAATPSINSCVNPLTVGNPVTLNINAIGLQRNDNASTAHAFQQASRIDVYRVSGPMATGKVGSLSCKFNLNVYGCNAFLDTGLAAGAALPTINTTGGMVAYNFGTLTNCAAVGSAASPSIAACGSASAGAFSCDVAASAATCTINTTAVTANSEIFVTEVADEGTRLGVTCNTAPTVVPAISLATKTAGTGFTINAPTFTVNPACFDYHIVN